MALKTYGLLTFFAFLCEFAFAQSPGGSSTQPTYRLNGGATLASNFVERGLTQTKNDPGVQSEFWFNLGSQFRIGLWGANVRYESTPTTHFWLRLNADLKVDFSENASMNILYKENKFFKSNDRDGNVVGLRLTFWKWKIIYDKESNWQGTQSEATYFGIGHEQTVWEDWTWSNSGGYLIPNAEGIASFFDVRTGLGIKAQDILLTGSVSYSTASGAFKDQGQLAFILSAQVNF
jgi:uncharacterized protein (TIGR02001 family)